MAEPIRREFYSAGAQIRQACGRDPFLLAVGGVFLAALSLADLFLSATGVVLVSAAGYGGHFAAPALCFFILLNAAVCLFSLLMIYFSVTVSAGLPPAPHHPPVAAAKFLASVVLFWSKISLIFSGIIVFFLLALVDDDDFVPK